MLQLNQVASCLLSALGQSVTSYLCESRLINKISPAHSLTHTRLDTHISIETLMVVFTVLRDGLEAIG